jgi:hypothetical protein
LTLLILSWVIEKVHARTKGKTKLNAVGHVWALCTKKLFLGALMFFTLIFLGRLSAQAEWAMASAD